MAKKQNLIAGGVILLVVLAAAAWLLRPSPEGTAATIWVDGQAVRRLDLAQEEGAYISLEEEFGKPVHFVVEGGKIRFADVDCPDHICEKTGFISQEGQTAVCMPNRVSLTIE